MCVILRSSLTWVGGVMQAGSAKKMTVEQALREFLTSLEDPVVADAPPIPVFRGQGVQPGVDLTDNAVFEDLMCADP